MTIFPGGPQDNIPYTLVAPDGSRAVFNNSADADYVGMARFTGLDGVDIREAIDPRSGNDGSVQGQNYRSGRAITCVVDIVPVSTTDRNQKVTKMKRAINALVADGTMTFQPDGGTPQQQVKYRLNLPHRRSDDQRGFKTQYQFGLMCADPNIYSAALRGPTSVTGGGATITNQGDGQAPATLSVVVTSTGTLKLRNNTAGREINLTGITLGAGMGAVSQTIGGGAYSSANGLFNSPYRAAVDGSGNVYVVDSGNSRVEVFNSSGVYQSKFGTAGSSNGQFVSPQGIAIDGAGKIWVVDTGNNRIQRFSAAGAYETQFGTAGSGNGQFNQPQGVCLDGAGNIFVADSGNNRIQKLTPGTPPTYASQFGTAGSGNNNLSGPSDVVSDAAGTSIFIVDTYNNRIKKVSNASPPVYASDFGSYGVATGQFSSPTSITRDSGGNLYVADTNNGRVQKFNPSGVFQSQFGSLGSGSSQLNNPLGVAMNATSSSLLYICDTGNNRVQRVTMPSTQLDLDLAIASVTQSGLNAYSFVDVPNTFWWALQPGDNVVQVTGSAAIASATISWRDAWL